MSDALDDLINKCLPDIQKSVGTGLKVVPPLDKYIVVDSLTDPLPYRVHVTWQEHPHEGCIAFPNGSCRTSLKQCDARTESANELSIALDIAVSNLRDNGSSVLDSAIEFAKRARAVERRTVLWLVAHLATANNSYNLETVRQVASSLNGPCRLIATGSVAEAAKKEGFVEDFVNPMGSLPTGVTAMLVRVGGGPTMRRVVDDLTLTVHRLSEATVQIRLSERFFLDDGAEAVKFCGV